MGCSGGRERLCAAGCARIGSAVKGRARQYIYVSTGAVYQIPFPTNGDESVRTIADETSEDTDKHYGALKALCERQVRDVFEDGALVLRLGLVTGPYDDTDRATYWMLRVAQGGEMLAPGKPDAHLQLIDGRDFARFVCLCIKKRVSGTYNTTGLSMTWQAWFDAFKTAADSDTRFTWIDDRAFLRAHITDERPEGALPLFLPAEWGDWWTNNNNRAQALGLTYRAPEATARDTLAWAATRPAHYQLQAGLPSEQEAALLERWQRT